MYIRFRVWDSYHKKMITKDVSDFCSINQDGSLNSNNGLGGCNPVMQCINISDKSGKLIYEFDILKETMVDGKERFYKVWAEKGGFVINQFQDDFYKPICSIHFYQSCSDMQNVGFMEHLEIIGNIYSNPSLLIK